MSVWSDYQLRCESRGLTKREAILKREERQLKQKILNSPSYHRVHINDEEDLRDVVILNSDNYDEKTIISMPHEDIHCGSIIFWNDYHWMMTERDMNNELYTRGKLEECNYILKWVDDDNIVRETYAIIEDGTKYFTGEMEDKLFFTTRGDSRIAVTVPRNEITCHLCRKNRFIIDDLMNGTGKLAYQLTKPMRTGYTYDEYGIYRFVMQEVNNNEYDNLELGIADYYKHFPRPPLNDIPNNHKGEVWI